MNNTLKYQKLFQLGIQNAMEYRTNFLLNIFGGVFTLTIQLFLWTAIFNNTNQTIVMGYTYEQLVIYTIMAALISNLVATGFEREILLDIKDGGLSKFLIQPINYFVYRLSCFLGQKSIEVVIIIVLSAILLIIFNAFISLNMSMSNILLAIVPIILAVFLNFLFFYCVSTVAFWLLDVSMLFWGINLLTLILSGAIFPLDIFGETISTVLSYFPFSYTVYFPINILTGKLEPSFVITGCLIQIAWIVILFILLKILWKTGLKKYVAVGG